MKFPLYLVLLFCPALSLEQQPSYETRKYRGLRQHLNGFRRYAIGHPSPVNIKEEREWKNPSIISDVSGQKARWSPEISKTFYASQKKSRERSKARYRRGAERYKSEIPIRDLTQGETGREREYSYVKNGYRLRVIPPHRRMTVKVYPSADGHKIEIRPVDEGHRIEIERTDDYQQPIGQIAPPDSDNSPVAIDENSSERKLAFETDNIGPPENDEVMCNDNDLLNPCSNEHQNIDESAVSDVAQDLMEEKFIPHEQNLLEDTTQSFASTNNDFVEEREFPPEIVPLEGSGDGTSENENLQLSRSRFINLFGNGNGTNSPCTTPKGNPGHCRNFRDCVLHDVLSNFSMFLQYKCVSQSAMVGICCPDNPVIEVTDPEENSTHTVVQDQILQPVEGCGMNARTRIVGGEISKPHEWTWMVALLRRNRFFCGGSLINSLYVLTAAHCVMGVNIRDITVRLGEHNFNSKTEHQQDIPLAEIKRHAQFTTLTFEHDIALLKLRRPVEYTRVVSTICLPKQGSDFVNVNATVVGWGTVSFGGAASPILRQVTIPVWDNSKCDKTYALENINDSFMCAGSPEDEQDACQGDSGGPLMAVNAQGRWEIIGLVSWGRRCGDPNYPGVYTRVTTYLDWINENSRT